MKPDPLQQLADYRGVLGWNAFTNGQGVSFPHVEVPLFIKTMSMPVRRPKVTEITGIPEGTYYYDSSGGVDTTLNALFLGAPDILQTEISGWLITPVSNNQWAPVDVNGSPLSYGNISYAEVVSCYIEGRLNRGPGGYLRRRDPDYFITPNGQYYVNPIIATWEPSYAPVQKKQPFTMILYLET